jgi:hypothetical protein
LWTAPQLWQMKCVLAFAINHAFGWMAATRRIESL